MPSLAYTLAGSGVVLLISSVTLPRHSGSSGVTLTMIPHRAYVDLPTQITSTSRGTPNTSTVSASANELGGTTTWSLPVSRVSMVMNESSEKFLGSTIDCMPDRETLVKTLKTGPTRTSYP